MVQVIKLRYFGGGDGVSNVIQSFNFNSKGNCSDFGNLTQARQGVAACGNELTAVFGGGDSHPSYYNVIDQVFMQRQVMQ